MILSYQRIAAKKLGFLDKFDVESTAALDLIRRIAKDVKENFQVRSELSECLNTSSMKVKRIYNEETEVKQDPQSCLGKIVL
ncbi:hypothetical protein Tco_0153690 [Tanacetum coccineum]